MPRFQPRLCVSLLAMALSQPALSAGLYLYEIGTEDVGLASAGSAARAEDATTIFTNPAGLTEVEGKQLDINAQVLFGDASYRITSGAARGNDPGNVIEPFPGVSAFYSHTVHDRLTVGIGMWGNFGLALHYGDWAGERLVKDAAQVALTLQPTVAYRVNDQWSLGAGLGINYGYFALKRDTPYGEETDTDHDWQANVRLGALYKPTATTRVGLNYTSKTDYEFAINPTITLTNPLNGATWQTPLSLTSTVNAPQQLMLSTVHDLNAQWSIMGNLGWQDWSSFNGNTATLNGETQLSNHIFQDTWHAALGARYRINERLHWNAGVAFDSSMYRNQNETLLTMPSGINWRFGTGVKYKLDQNSSVGVAAEYLRTDGSTVSGALFGGEFDTSHLFFVTTQYSRKF